MLQFEYEKSAIVRTVLFLLFNIVTICFVATGNPVHAEMTTGNTGTTKAIPVPNPATDLWRAVRQREGDMPAITTQVRGVNTNVLVDESGEEFRDLRRNKLIPYLFYLLLGMVGIITLFYLIHGQQKIDGGTSGLSVQRFRKIERMTHWFIAILFIYLAITGLILLFGRFILLPIIGKEAFSLLASACKETHELVGPLFLVGLILLFILFVARNIPGKGDIKWMLKGGGYGKQHVKAGFFNAGEKIWFWLVILIGLTVSITGLIMDFPIFGQGRNLMQLALLIHAIAAGILIAVSFGHIYLATIGTEGALRGMKTGRVDVNWAKTHHDLWLQELDASSEIQTDAMEPPVAKIRDDETNPVHT